MTATIKSECKLNKCLKSLSIRDRKHLICLLLGDQSSEAFILKTVIENSIYC